MKHLAHFLTLALFLLAIAACNREPVGTCTDNLLNQDETGVDCGGPCEACPTCSDNLLNQGELAVDCGGPCPACVVSVPCSPDRNSWTITGLPTMYYNDISYTITPGGDLEYKFRLQGSHVTMITFSKFYTFNYGAEFETVQAVSSARQVAIRVETSSNAYFIGQSNAYVNVSGDSIFLTVCNGVTYNNFVNTTSSGQVSFRKLH